MTENRDVGEVSHPTPENEDFNSLNLTQLLERYSKTPIDQADRRKAILEVFFEKLKKELLRMGGSGLN